MKCLCFVHKHWRGNSKGVFQTLSVFGFNTSNDAKIIRENLCEFVAAFSTTNHNIFSIILLRIATDSVNLLFC